jgi:RNA ligase (TIGR02306 family)
MMTSTHRVEVVPVTLEPHANADALSIVRVYGYTAVVRTDDWTGVDRAAYVPPDSIVPGDREPFAFLGPGSHRIKAKRLRGVMSFGLLVPAPEGAALGDDVADALGVTHYEPPIRCDSGGEAVAGPPGVVAFRYDLEAWRRYGTVLRPGEDVYVSEKLHGANGRFCYADGVMYAGSRTEWKREDASNLWWRALQTTPSIRAWCEANPGDVLYGEVFGAVQDLRYGMDKGGVTFAAFDILSRGEWMDIGAMLRSLDVHGVPRVPAIYAGPYDPALIDEWTDGPSLWPGANHVREGCVVRPVSERRDDECGRVVLKCVSGAYLERAA